MFSDTSAAHASAPHNGQTLRICIACETYAPEVNGAAKFAERLATALAGRGHEVHVICPSPNGKRRNTRQDGVILHYVKSVRWRPHPTWRICMPWDTRPAVAQILDAIRPDVVHTQAHFVIGRFAFNEARKRGIPVVATNHFMPGNVRPYLPAPDPVLDIVTKGAWWDLRRKFESADYITVPTQLAADLLTDHGFTHDIHPVSCGIDLSKFHAACATGDTAQAEAPTVLFVGRLSAEKNATDIVRALAKTDPALNLHAEIIGHGDQAPVLEALAVELGVAERVRLLGKVDDDALVSAYQRATFFCLPGTAELQSIATLEALASGKPVVLADAVALPHLCRDGENGYLFTPRDTDDLAAKFTRLLTASQEERAAMGRVSQEIVAKHDIENTLNTFEDIYAEVIAAHSRVRRPA
nr:MULTISPECIES: glycosyltransferase [unclassified Brevibacterium]